MRSKLTAATAAMLAAGLVGAAIYVVTAAPAAGAAASDQYSFKNVEIVGGGFVPGIVFNSSRQNLVYARTDIGGTYRWNPSTGRWVPLQDFTAPGDWNLLGADALATDPVDPNRLLVLVGEYTQSFAGNAAVLRSTDQGNTFARTDLPFKAGGNESGRSIGERLAIDPNRDSVVFMGTRNDGLWKSTDFGATWAQVTGFTARGQSGIGVGWIQFDKGTGTSGNPTQTIYVGVGDTSNSIYVSTNGGSSWSLLAGQPNAGKPHHGKLASDGTLYVSYGDQPGPYAEANGAVWKRTGAGVWTNITPLVPYTNGETGFGYAGLAVDAQHPQTVMVATMARWGPVDDIFRSTNGGASWTSITAHKSMDVSGAPFLSWHATPKLGWMIGSLEIDPFNANRFLYGTGATIFGSDDASNAEAGGTVHINVRAQGLEETAVLDLISPPSGPPLLSALGDIGVYRHDNLSVVPPNGMATNPIYGNASTLDYAELAPGQLISAGAASSPDRHASFSSDGGNTWTMTATEPENPEGQGNVAMAADGSAAVWSPSQRGVFFSTNKGGSWTASTGLSGSTVAVRSDRVNPNTFYATINGSFFVSTNKGASFSQTASGLPTGSTYFKAVPGREGDIWLTTGYGGLYHSTNTGAAFTKLANVTEAYTVGFGKAAPGQTYPAVFLNGIVDGVNGLFRSDDAGTTWVRINDNAHQYGWIGRTITGDPRVYGRVYFSTNGRGVIYGDRIGTGTPPPPPTTVSAVPTSRSASASASSSRPASSAPASSSAPATGACTAAYSIVNAWQGAFQGQVVVKAGSTAVNGWTVRWTYADGQVISQLWGGLLTQSPPTETVRNETYNGSLAAGATTTFGFIASAPGSANAVPTNIACTSP